MMISKQCSKNNSQIFTHTRTFKETEHLKINTKNMDAHLGDP